jgi:hypothetical protein
MAEEAAEAQVESNAQDTSVAQETPDATEQAVTKEISTAGETAPAAEAEQVADETSGDKQEQEALAVEPALYRRAVLAGLDDEAIADLGTPAAVERAITLLESHRPPDGAKGDAKEADGRPQKEQAASEVKDPEWKLPPMDDVHESITTALKMVPQYVSEYVKAQLSRQNPEVAGLKDQLKGMSEYVSMVQQERTDADVDRYVSGLGAEWEKTFGKGSVDDLDPNSDGMKNRAKLYDRALVEAKVAAASGKRPPSLLKCLELARSSLFREQSAKQERIKLLKTAKSAKGVLLAKPSNKSGTPGVDDAEKQVLEKIKSAIG